MEKIPKKFKSRRIKKSKGSKKRSITNLRKRSGSRKSQKLRRRSLKKYTKRNDHGRSSASDSDASVTSVTSVEDDSPHILYACKRYGEWEYVVVIVYSKLEEGEISDWLRREYGPGDWEIEPLYMNKGKDLSELQFIHCRD
jgi:hypothetical protein